MEKEINATTYIEKVDGDVTVNQFDPQSKAILESLANRAFVADEAKAEEIAGRKILDLKLKQTSDLIKDYKYYTAQKFLIELREEESAENTFTNAYKAKIANNLGVCALNLNDIPHAREEFGNAIKLDPNNAKLLGNAAMAAFADRDFDSAFSLSSEARGISPQDSAATSVYIQSLNAKKEIDSIENLLNDESWVLDDPYCLLALGVVFYLNEQYERAEDYLRESLKRNSSEPQIFELLTITIFQPIIIQLQDDTPLPWRRSETLIKRIKEAKDFSDQEVDLLKSSENRSQYLHALSIRAQIKAFLRDFEGALEDCEKVLVEEKLNSLALNTKGIALFHLQKFKDSRETLTTVTDPYIRESGIIIEATAFLSDNLVTEALDLLKDYWNPDSDEEKKIRIAEILSFAYLKSTNSSEDKIIDLSTFLNAEKWKHNVDVARIKADTFYHQGKFPEAKKVLIDALPFGTNNQKDYIYLTLAQHAFFQAEWEDAVIYYPSVVDENTPLDIKRQYAVSLLNAGKYEAAFDYTKAVRNGNDPIPVISDIEARILEYIGDLPAALELRLRLHELTEDENEAQLVRSFMLAMRLGKEDIARDIISKLDLAKIQNSPWALSHVAQAYILLNIENAISLSYKALKLGFNSAEYHLSYFRVFLASKNSESTDLRPAQVANNCIVEIVLSSGEKQSYLLTDEEPEDKQKNIIPLTDSLALKLLGKSIGDEITIRDNPLQKLTAKIIEIKSKYVYAFQDSLLNFPTRFPENTNLHTIDVGDNDFSVIFSELDRKFAHISYVMQLHNERRLPLSVIASVLQKSRLAAWSGMVTDTDGSVFATNGNLSDMEGNINSNRIVLDLIGILSANYLGILEKLPEVFEDIYVSQAVLDEINNELLDDARNSTQMRATIGRGKGGSYFHHEYSQSEIENHSAFLHKLRDFVTNKTKVVSAPGALLIEKDKFDEIKKVLGESAISSILIAKEKEALLYADDISVSQFATQDWNVQSIWTQIILANLTKRKILTKDDYHEGIYKLLIGNYKAVSFNLEDLLWAIRKSDWKITEELERFMRVIEGPQCDARWAIESGAELIKQAVLNISQPENRIFFIDFVIKLLIKGRNKSNALSNLKLKLINKFYLIPLQLPDVIKTVDYWMIHNIQ